MTRSSPLRSDSRLETVLRQFWSGEAGRWSQPALGIATAPFAALYGSGVRLRNAAFDRGLFRCAQPPIPVVSVGNLAVGGTGKTPVTRWLVSRILDRAERPAIVSRGYGEDELLLHRRWHPEVPVLKAAERIEGVRRAAREGCTVAVVDDGFQHRAMARDVDLVLFSPAHPPPVRVLPRGPYREPLSALRRADLALVTLKARAERGPAEALMEDLRALPGGPPVELLEFRPGPWEDLGGKPSSPPVGGVLAVASVAQPEGFRKLLEEDPALHGAGDVELLGFPDHHPYDQDDVDAILERAGARMVATTEKDAVKLAPLVSGRHASRFGRFRVLPLQVRPGRRAIRRLDEAINRALTSGTSSGAARSRGPR